MYAYLILEDQSHFKIPVYFIYEIHFIEQQQQLSIGSMWMPHATNTCK